MNDEQRIAESTGRSKGRPVTNEWDAESLMELVEAVLGMNYFLAITHAEGYGGDSDAHAYIAVLTKLTDAVALEAGLNADLVGKEKKSIAHVAFDTADQAMDWFRAVSDIVLERYTY